MSIGFWMMISPSGVSAETTDSLLEDGLDFLKGDFESCDLNEDFRILSDDLNDDFRFNF